MKSTSILSPLNEEIWNDVNKKLSKVFVPGNFTKMPKLFLSFDRYNASCINETFTLQKFDILHSLKNGSLKEKN